MVLEFNKKSTNIIAMAYKDSILAVEFKRGVVYHYLDVSQTLVDTMLNEVNVKDKSLGKTVKDLILDTDIEFERYSNGAE